jgi:hypothetical protein
MKSHAKQKKRQLGSNEDLIDDSLALMNQTYDQQYADMSILERRTTTIDEEE